MNRVSLMNCSLRGRGNLPFDTITRVISSQLFSLQLVHFRSRSDCLDRIR